MDPNLDPAALERRIWRSIHEDGLLEVLVGCLFLGLTLYTSLRADSAWGDGLAGLAGVAGGVIWWCGKRFVTAPRAGLVRLGPKGTLRMVKGVAVVVASILLNLAWLAMSLVNRDSQSLFHPPFLVGGFLGANALLCFGLLAWLLDHPRFYLVAVLAAAAFTLRGWLLAKGLPGGTLAFLVPAGLLLGTGFALLLRFLRRYPLEAR